MIIERVNRQMRDESILFQSAAATVMGGQKGNAAFKRTLTKYTADTKPRSSAPEKIKWPPDEPDKEP